MVVGRNDGRFYRFPSRHADTVLSKLVACNDMKAKVASTLNMPLCYSILIPVSGAGNPLIKPREQQTKPACMMHVHISSKLVLIVKNQISSFVTCAHFDI